MIKLLGQITIPEQLIEYLKISQPAQVRSQLAGASFKEQIKILAQERNVNVENYKFYTEENTGTIEYREDWFKTIVPDNFLQQQGIVAIINAVVLKVNPGQFQAPTLIGLEQACIRTILM